MLVIASVRPPLSPHLAKRLSYVAGIYATVINPWSGQPLRVRVERVDTVNILSQDGEPPYKVAIVRALPENCLSFSVRIAELKNIMVDVAQEVE